MPSYIAWAAALLSIIIGKLLPLPLGWLQRFLPLPELFACLRFPFVQMSAFVLLLGSVFQTGMLVEELARDKLGSCLNSAAKSFSPSSLTLPALHADLERAEEQLSRFSTFSYPSAVSQLLDKALALPTIPEDSDITFTAADIQEWEDGSRTLRSEYERLGEQAARQWVDVLTYDPARGSLFLPGSAGPATPPNSASPKLANPVYLAAVETEMQLVQAGRASKAVYAEREYGEEEWAALMDEKERKEREEQERADAQFEEFLDRMFAGAEGVAESEIGDFSPLSDADIPSSCSPFAPTKRARELLDQPQNPALPISSTNPTWRTTLRHQFDMLYNPSKGGVLGEAMQSVSQGLADLGGVIGDGNEAADGKAAEQTGWAPKGLPLMANHLLRAHVQQALSLSTLPANAWEKVWGVDAKAEERILPSILSGFPTEYLTPAQRAVRVDQQARRWATSLLSLFFAAPSPAPSTATTLDPRAVATLLRSSPFPSFIRTAEELFALPLQHMRMSVSKHEMAYAVFANEAQMQQGGKQNGEVGRVAVEWALKQVKQVQRDIEETQESARDASAKQKHEL
ncbi:hypothetical protein JCM11251_007284 [Rhodosporidiobolus azoricus]